VCHIAGEFDDTYSTVNQLKPAMSLSIIQNIFTDMIENKTFFFFFIK
jgi:hypothetical protein